MDANGALWIGQVLLAPGLLAVWYGTGLSSSRHSEVAASG